MQDARERHKICAENVEIYAREAKQASAKLSFVSLLLLAPRVAHTSGVGLLKYECVRSPPGHLHSATGDLDALTLLMTSTETIIRVNFFGAIVIRVILSSE